MTLSTELRRRELLISLAALAVTPGLARAAGGAIPGDSIYRLDAQLQDQDGRPFALSSLQGTPVLASMFYSSCDMVCPMIFETVHATLRALPAAQRSEVRVLMVSFDPARDTVAVLKQTARARNCDGQWVLARADEGTARKIAAILGIQYRKLADGEYNHSTVIDVLDPAGRIMAKTGKLGSVDQRVTDALRKMAAG
jgi:protein SCO1/2